MRNSPALFAGALLLASCSIEEVLDVDPVATIEVSAPYAAISPGEVHQLRVLLRDADGSDLGPRATRWSALDPTVATVDAEGRATGVAVGSARFVARSEGASDTVTIPVRSSWARVWSGARLVCAERIGGGTYCWGDVAGDGSTGTHYAPVPVAGGLTLRDVVRATPITCGRADDGTLRCWDGVGYYPSEYGNGADSGHGPTPRLAAGGKAFTSFGAHYFSGPCGVTADGMGWCWGSVPHGVDTIGTFVFRDAPDTVLGGIAWRTLLPGENGVCGLDTGGLPYCFGRAHPLLGQGDEVVRRRLPTPVVGGHTFDSLVVNGRNACGLKGNGEVWCWGEGAIGVGGGYVYSGTPAQVAGGRQFRLIRAGYTTSYCGIDATDALWCWGNVPERVETPFTFIDVAAGSNLCGLTAGGGLYCRGTVLLGNGSPAPSDEFVRVMDPE